MPTGPVYVVGDVHGHLDKMMVLLRRAGLMSEALTWTGRDATLWFCGDFVDRGPEGLASVDLAMWLQREAEAAGGKVDALLGNHDLLLVAARRYGGSFLADWRRNGGIADDLRKLRPRHVNWLLSRPAMARVGDTLLLHADATFYLLYGSSVEEVNASVAEAIATADPTGWDRLLEQFSERHAFDGTTPGGTQRAADFLRRFHAVHLIHGHTPISFVTRVEPTTIVGPHVYAGGLAVNVDGGMYLGGSGFVYRIDNPSG